MTYFTTGMIRDGDGWRRGRPSRWAKWLFLKFNASRLENPAERQGLMVMANRKLVNENAEIGDLTGDLGPAGLAVRDLILNRDPDQVPEYLARLPGALRADFAALNFSDKDLSKLGARLLLIHGRDDPVIPASESMALAEAATPGAAEVYLVDQLAHVDLKAGWRQGPALWQAALSLIALRDGTAGKTPSRIASKR